MFFKKKQKYVAPKTTNFFLKFNLTAIKEWLKDKKEIQPQDRYQWDKSSHVRQYKITMLPHDPFLFYHEELNAIFNSD